MITKSSCIFRILHHCKEQLFSFLSMQFVLLCMISTIQDPAKYQKDTKYDHEFLHSRSVIGYLHSQRRVIENRTTRHGDLAVHLLPGVCSVGLF